MPVLKLVRFICVACGKEFEALCDARRSEKPVRCPECGGAVQRSRVYVLVPGLKMAKRRAGTVGKGK
jgi:putative FmdB family regulatory protein